MTPRPFGQPFSRRRFLELTGLGAAGISAAAVADAAVLDPSALAAARHVPPAQLGDIEHVVILMQENRSFDHYFGSLSGIRGFGDRSALQQPDGLSVFYQPDADAAQNPSGLPYVLPWHLDSRTTNAQASEDLSHAWSVQHFSWNNGLMDGFVSSHRVADDIVDKVGSPPYKVTNYGPLTMGYFNRADLPYHYALADAFTICDAYHASVQGPTNPNRIMFMSGTIDADGTMGGPCIDNSQTPGQLRWEAYPERLQRAGIDWRVYQETDNFTDNMLPFFKAFREPRTEIYRRGNSFIPTPKGERYGPALAAKLKHDVVTGNLPQVSWIIGSYLNSEHPEATPGWGARFVNEVLDALTADPKVWAKTALILNFDENDGFFDHVVPPTPSKGTPGEYIPEELSAKLSSTTMGWSGPVGLSFRVPMLVISPFSRGGLCCSDVFDHTSTLLFLERRFGVEVPYISKWRRETVGDLTSAFDFASGRNPSLPTLPDANALADLANRQAHLPAPKMPADQQLPTQEKGPRRRRPSGPVRHRHGD